MDQADQSDRDHSRAPMRGSVILFCLVTACGALGVSDVVAEHPAAMDEFVTDHCVACHDGPDGEGGFDVASLSHDLDDPATFQRWVRVLDRVVEGEMPPPEDGALDEEQIEAFRVTAEPHLASHQDRQHSQLGRVRGRRLSNRQLQATLGDLLVVDLPLAKLVPEELRTAGFWGIADGQTMSHFHLESHLKMVDAALDEAWRRLFEGKPIEYDLPANKIANKPPGRRNREPEMYNGAAVGWNSTLPFYPRIESTKARESGWYDIELTASGLNIPEDQKGVWCTIRSGACRSGAPLMYWIDSFQAAEKPRTWKFRAYIRKEHQLEIRVSDVRLPKARFQGGQVAYGVGGPQKVPGVAMHRIKMKQVFPAGNHDKVVDRLFGKLNVSLNQKKRRVTIEEDDVVKACAVQLRNFATRAFRRPVSRQEVLPYAEFLRSEIHAGREPADALRSAYRAVLCSPRFLYFNEQPGRLDDSAFAVRLSYLLTGSTPDWPLAKAARLEQLGDAQAVIKYADRILAGDRLDRFVADFAHQWLDLADIDFTEPDPKLHRDFDIVVQHAMISETEKFLADAFRRNASVTELVHAGHTFVNGRLASYYGIKGNDHDRVQRVLLDKSSERGGLLSQGAILKVTANGNDTSPVVRGVWVSERILGCEIPPPPENVPAVEPDIRGAKTIRDQLALHQSDGACASCHRNIDPPGYALESFDAAGRWRKHYPKWKGRRVTKGLPIDPSFVLADGRSFDDFLEFKALLADKPEPLARNLAAKLITYGTGSEIQFADRDDLDAIVAQCAQDHYGVRSILNAVITSDLFRQK